MARATSCLPPENEVEVAIYSVPRAVYLSLLIFTTILVNKVMLSGAQWLLEAHTPRKQWGLI